VFTGAEQLQGEKVSEDGSCFGVIPDKGRRTPHRLPRTSVHKSGLCSFVHMIGLCSNVHKLYLWLNVHKGRPGW
jgi:hypothetical protein